MTKTTWKGSTIQREKLGPTLGRVPEILFQHTPPIDGLYNGCIGQYRVIFWEQLLGYPPKDTQVFPMNHGQGPQYDFPFPKLPFLLDFIHQPQKEKMTPMNPSNGTLYGLNISRPILQSQTASYF